jgi:hypothetical protein
VSGQLALFAEPDATAFTADLQRDVPAGAERLLRELVKRGLHEGDMRLAAALCIVLDEESRR